MTSIERFQFSTDLVPSPTSSNQNTRSGPTIDRTPPASRRDRSPQTLLASPFIRRVLVEASESDSDEVLPPLMGPVYSLLMKGNTVNLHTDFRPKPKKVPPKKKTTERKRRRSPSPEAETKPSQIKASRPAPKPSPKAPAAVKPKVVQAPPTLKRVRREELSIMSSVDNDLRAVLDDPRSSEQSIPTVAQRDNRMSSSIFSTFLDEAPNRLAEKEQNSTDEADLFAPIAALSSRGEIDSDGEVQIVRRRRNGVNATRNSKLAGMGELPESDHALMLGLAREACMEQEIADETGEWDKVVRRLSTRTVVRPVEGKMTLQDEERKARLSASLLQTADFAEGGESETALDGLLDSLLTQ